MTSFIFFFKTKRKTLVKLIKQKRSQNLPGEQNCETISVPQNYLQYNVNTNKINLQCTVTK